MWRRSIVTVMLLVFVLVLAGCANAGEQEMTDHSGHTMEEGDRTLPGEWFPDQGKAHLANPNQRHAPYNSNPPTSGPHVAALPRPGAYAEPPRPEGIPHFLEHGGVWVLYNCPDGCAADVQALQAVVTTEIDRGRPLALAPYPQMESRFALVAWQYLLQLDHVDQDAITAFIAAHACRFNPEGGPYCRDAGR